MESSSGNAHVSTADKEMGNKWPLYQAVYGKWLENIKNSDLVGQRKWGGENVEYVTCLDDALCYPQS